jgi:hypothetical protein
MEKFLKKIQDLKSDELRSQSPSKNGLSEKKIISPARSPLTLQIKEEDKLYQAVISGNQNKVKEILAEVSSDAVTFKVFKAAIEDQDQNIVIMLSEHAKLIHSRVIDVATKIGNYAIVDILSRNCDKMKKDKSYEKNTSSPRKVFISEEDKLYQTVVSDNQYKVLRILNEVSSSTITFKIFETAINNGNLYIITQLAKYSISIDSELIDSAINNEKHSMVEILLEYGDRVDTEL